MVQAGLKVIPNAIGSIRDIIKVVTSSPSRMQIFDSIVQSLGFRSKSGVLDVPHRWNATYDMLNEDLKYKVALLNRFAVEQYHQAPSE